MGAERAPEQASAAQSDVDYRRPGLARALREGNSGGGAERLRVFLLRPHPPAQRTAGQAGRLRGHRVAADVEDFVFALPESRWKG